MDKVETVYIDGMKVTITHIPSALKMGIYKETSEDVRKREADFRLLQVGPYVIRWKDGRTETVNKRALEKLQKQHPNWVTDF